MNNQFFTLIYRGADPLTAKLVAMSDNPDVARAATNAIRDEIDIDDARESLSLTDSTYGEPMPDEV